MDILSDILHRMQLAGTLYFRTSFTSPWGVQVPSFEDVSRFHFAYRGRCLARVAGVAEPVLLEQGDLIIITRGAAHTLYCDPKTETAALPLDQMLEKSGFTGSGTLVYGEPGTSHETQLVCGHFAFNKHANHPLIQALPAYIHIRNYGAIAGHWMETALKVIGEEAGSDKLGSDLMALKMSEIIYTQALRIHLNTEGVDQPVLAGFSDTKLAKVLQAIHANPAHPWRIEELSGIASMSRTSFISKFTDNLSMTPLGYITHWRMQIARQLLVDSSASIIEIAEQVGYQSEAAFGRVFRKHFEQGPSGYRRQSRQTEQIYH
ncbi:AraC family transcriptional regulator [Aliamphritea ceti]|uniref:AraC family transcriptional regulator n=1 Tax=Aliamphritea ceti TaxID=1524258 RepID=UPI0021C489A7|nr:AraC family transcriptional regulator [Aliamphritea ceti]